MGPASKEASSSQSCNVNQFFIEKNKNDEIQLDVNSREVVFLNVNGNYVTLDNPPSKVVAPLHQSTSELSALEGMTAPVTAALVRIPIVSTSSRSYGLITTISPSLFRNNCNGASQSLLNSFCYQGVPGMHTLIPASQSNDKLLNSNGNDNSLVGSNRNMGSLNLVNKFLSKSIAGASNYPPDIMSLNGFDDVNIQEVSDCSLSSKLNDTTSGMAEIGILTNVDMVLETTRRQKEFEKRLDLLSRRLRRLQGRSALSHMQHQLGSFVKHQHANLQTMAKSIRSPPTTTLDLKTDLLQKEDVKNLSTAALVDLVRRVQSSQQALTLKQQLAGSLQSSENCNILKLNADLCVEMNRVSSTFQMNLGHVESGMDSDATETSSGGESCEEECDDDERSSKFAIKKRAECHWFNSRSAIGARWAWLQAQVSDLEYRIRQHTDIYRQIRAAKGPVVLNDSFSTPECISNKQGTKTVRKLTPLEEKIANIERKNSELTNSNLSSLLHLDKQTNNASSPVLNSSSSTNSYSSINANSKSSQAINGLSLDSLLSTPVNELNNDDISNNCILNSNETISDDSCQAARCKPVKSYGKRKLLRTVGLHCINKKASRLSTINCNCYPPVTPCAMCCGRYNNVQHLDLYTMSYNERVSLLDPGYHSVLSFNEDIALPLLFESSLKSTQSHKLQHRSVRPFFERRRRYANELVKKKFSRKTPKVASAVMLSSAKIRNKYENKQLTRNVAANPFVRGGTDVVKKRRGLNSIDIKKKHRLPHKQSQAYSNMNNCYSRDHPINLKESLRKRRLESAYDINNIVLPYGMATSTRVEKIQYKEIVTPKWRVVPAYDNTSELKMPADSNEEEIEDISDDSYTMRHLRCEIAERKKFAGQLKNNRRSRSQRSDSNTTIVELLNVENESTDVSNPSNENFSLKDDNIINEMDSFENMIRLRHSSRSSSESRSVDYDEIFSNQFFTEPWEKRIFPLPEDEMSTMLKDKPFLKRKLNSVCNNTIISPKEKYLLSTSANRTTHNSDSSSDLGDEDTNDPDWALPHEERTKNISLSNLVLKLNNR